MLVMRKEYSPQPGLLMQNIDINLKKYNNCTINISAF